MNNIKFSRMICLAMALLMLAAVFSGCGMIRRVGSMVGRFVSGKVEQPSQIGEIGGLEPEELLPEELVPEEFPAVPDVQITPTEPAVTEPPEPEYAEPGVVSKPSFPLGGEITASVLNVRAYPGTGYEIVRGLERGTRVTVYEQQEVDGELWGRVSGGWVSMKYVALDGVVEGSWYQLVEENFSDNSLLYRIWSFHSDGSFLFTDFRLKEADDYAVARQEGQGGGSYSFESGTIWLDFTHGDSVELFFSPVGNPGAVLAEVEITGAEMIWTAEYQEYFERGTLENIQKQLRKQVSMRD